MSAAPPPGTSSSGVAAQKEKSYDILIFLLRKKEEFFVYKPEHKNWTVPWESYERGDDIWTRSEQLLHSATGLKYTDVTLLPTAAGAQVIKGHYVQQAELKSKTPRHQKWINSLQMNLLSTKMQIVLGEFFQKQRRLSLATEFIFRVEKLRHLIETDDEMVEILEGIAGRCGGFQRRREDVEL